MDKRLHAFLDCGTALCSYGDEEEPIGYLWYKHDTGIENVSYTGKDAHITQMGLYERYQRQGIGTKLINDACNRIKAAGGEYLYTDTYAFDNYQPMAFYVKNGFIPFSLLPGLGGKDSHGQVYFYKALFPEFENP